MPDGVKKPQPKIGNVLPGASEESRHSQASCAPCGRVSPRADHKREPPSLSGMAQAKIQAKMTEAITAKFSRSLSMAARSGRLLESLDQLEAR